jgi:hypothetical protein
MVAKRHKITNVPLFKKLCCVHNWHYILGSQSTKVSTMLELVSLVNMGS